jgi:hypothetical protein
MEASKYKAPPWHSITEKLMNYGKLHICDAHFRLSYNSIMAHSKHIDIVDKNSNPRF